MAIQIDGRSLNPDIAGQFARGQQTSQNLDNQRLQGQVQQFNLDRAKAGILGDQQAAQQKTQNQQLAGSLIGGNFKGQERQKKIGELFAANPDLAAKTLTQLGVQDQASADEFANFAFDLQNTPFELRGPKIEQRAQLLTSQGRDPKDTISLANLNEDQQNQVAETIQLAALSVKDRADVAKKSDDRNIKREGLNLRKQEAELRKGEIAERRIDNQLKRETNEVKRQELQTRLSETKVKNAQAKRDREFNAKSSIDAVQGSVDTIDKLLSGTNLERASGFESNFPTIAGTDAGDFEATLETLQSQAFLSQVEKMKGLGALSENEGKKLGAALGTLTTDLSDKALRTELTRVRGILTKAKSAMESKFNTGDGASSEALEGSTIINRSTGERMQLVNGQWEAL